MSTAILAACGGSCGGSTSTSSNNTPAAEATPSAHKAANLTLPTDICTLVTTADVAAALKVDQSKVLAGGATIPGACFYTTQTDTPTVVYVLAQSYPDSSTAAQIQPDQMAAAYKSLYGISNAKSVTGIGDKAFEYSATSATAGTTGVAIFVFKANVILFLIMSPTSDAAAIETMAKTAVGRLS